MNSHRLSSSILVFVFLSIWIIDVRGQNNFVITDFGAVPGGVTDSKNAFAHAWKKACQTPGGVVSVPAGKTFKLSRGDFFGPCNGATTFRMDGTLVATNDPKIDDLEYWIVFDKVDRIRVIGKGVFNGNGATAWSRCGKSSNCPNRPASLRFHAVNGALIRGITSLNSKMFHIDIQTSQNVKLQRLRIEAPAESPNTDGIHVGKSRGVQILGSIITTGDDCVSLGDGSQNILISGVKCGPGHGISIGSLGKYENEEDVGGITVTNSVITNTDNGLRIKTFAPSKSSPLVSNVTFSDIRLVNIQNPIVIDQQYCPKGGCKKSGESGVQIDGVKFVNVRGTSAEETAVSVHCSKAKPCKGVEFAGVNLMTANRRPTVASCVNYNGRFRSSIPSRC